MWSKLLQTIVDAVEKYFVVNVLALGEEISVYTISLQFLVSYWIELEPAIRIASIFLIFRFSAFFPSLF